MRGTGSRSTRFLLLALFGAWLAACAVNPVTGERELQFYDSDWETSTGAELYAPMRQSQGGDWTLDPQLVAYVDEVGQRLAARARRGSELDFEFHVLNDSTPNAWALPGGKIVINRGLLTELRSEAELAAVLGHEIVHADAAHGARAQSKGMLTQLGAVAGMVLIGSQVDSEWAQAAMMVPVLGAQLVTQKYGRDAEREADLYGMEYMAEAGYDPQGAVELQETFVRLSEGRDSDWVSGLFASHPPSRERVAANRATAARLPAGGETGRDRYLAMTARLREVTPAYEAYDEARERLADDDLAGAQRKLDEALRIEPREARFHALAGRIALERGDGDAALKAYDRAVSLDDGYFLTRLGRGRAALALGRGDEARADLERSLEMLPTAEAHYLLGTLDRRNGNLDTARYHFGQAAKSDSPEGRDAQRELVRLDIGRRPEDFIATAAAADRDGRVYARIGNRTRVPLSDIQVEVAWATDDGRVERTVETYRGVLDGGALDAIALGYRVSPGEDLERRIRLAVTAARLADEARP